MAGGGTSRVLIAGVSVAVTLGLGGVAMIAPRLGHGVRACASPPESSYGEADGERTGETRRPAYAIRTTIHDGGRELDVGRPVLSFVRTDRGFVAIRGNAAWRDGEPAELVVVDGNDVRHLADLSSGSAHLYADDAGSLVAFYEDDELVVVDLAQDDERILRWGGSSTFDSSAPTVLALDDGKVYVRDSGAVRPFDLESCETGSLPVEAGQVEDVAGEVVAESTDGGSTYAVQVRRLSAEEGRLIRGAEEPVLSPDGGYVAVRVQVDDEPGSDGRIIEVDTGADVTPPAGDYTWRWFFDWLGTGQVVGFAATTEPRGLVEDRLEVDVIRCAVGSGSCRVIGHETLRIDRFAVPTGRSARFGD